MSSEFGRVLRVEIFGTSHGPSIGVKLEGLPAGESIDLQELHAFLDRRRPGKSPLATARKETDLPHFLSGLENGCTTGAVLQAVIENSGQRSADYDSMADTPRPGHADYTAWAKWHGTADMRGGGQFSGRLTAPICVAGGIAGMLYLGHHDKDADNAGDGDKE
jgi:chorismate synthase